jgi:hypothetical protein
LAHLHAKPGAHGPLRRPVLSSGPGRRSSGPRPERGEAETCPRTAARRDRRQDRGHRRRARDARRSGQADPAGALPGAALRRHVDRRARPREADPDRPSLRRGGRGVARVWTSPEGDAELELFGLSTPGPPLLHTELPVPAAETVGWSQYLWQEFARRPHPAHRARHRPDAGDLHVRVRAMVRPRWPHLPLRRSRHACLDIPAISFVESRQPKPGGRPGQGRSQRSRRSTSPPLSEISGPRGSDARAQRAGLAARGDPLTGSSRVRM